MKLLGEHMNDHVFDFFTRHGAQGVTRRSSPNATETAGSPASKGPLGAAKKSAGKKAKQKCQRQIGQCTTFYTTVCQGNADCLAKAERCCPELVDCDLLGFLTCQ
jgi:hypothetical protein